jgi:23S rRNA pseudouridine1911/1915/1917 synthase
MVYILHMHEVIISKWNHFPFDSKSKRLQEGAIGQFANLTSRKSVKKAIKNGLIFVNGAKGETGTWVSLGDILIVKEMPNKSLTIHAENTSEIKILWEDNSCACVLKRAGIVTKGPNKHTLESIASNNLIKSTLDDSLQIPLAVHRLDKATHGPVLFAKTTGAASSLGDSFEKRKISKEYMALIEGTPFLTSATIRIEINGKEAHSEIEIVGATSWPVFGSATLVKVYPKTGRTHQIRRHLACIGHPILGDQLYSGDLKYTGQGLFLACTKLSFTHPKTKENIEISVDLPRKFKHIAHKLCLP